MSLINVNFLRAEIEKFMEENKSKLEYEAYFGMAILYEFIEKKLKEING